MAFTNGMLGTVGNCHGVTQYVFPLMWCESTGKQTAESMLAKSSATVNEQIYWKPKVTHDEQNLTYLIVYNSRYLK